MCRIWYLQSVRDLQRPILVPPVHVQYCSFYVSKDRGRWPQKYDLRGAINFASIRLVKKRCTQNPTVLSSRRPLPTSHFVPSFVVAVVVTLLLPLLLLHGSYTISKGTLVYVEPKTRRGRPNSEGGFGTVTKKKRRKQDGSICDAGRRTLQQRKHPESHCTACATPLMDASHQK
jgi:hypothetical protein